MLAQGPTSNDYLKYVINMLKSRSVLKKLHSETGASAVEFAIILPVLIIILFGIFEFGLVYRDYLAITHAAREGARMAAVGDYSEAEVKQRSYPVTPSSVTMSYLTVDGAPRHGETVEVVVAYDHPLNVPMFKKGTVRLTSKARMRIEF